MKTLGLIGLALLGVTASAGAQQPPATKDKDEVPAEYKPPKGMCRIWLKDVPPQQQPAPTDCASAVKKVPPNGRVIFGDPADNKKGKAKPDSLPETAQGFTGKRVAPVIIKKPPLPR